MKNKKIFIIIIAILIIVVFLGIFKNKILKIIYPKTYKEIVSVYSEKYNLEENLVFALIKAESNFNSEAVSHRDAIGVMQIMEETAKDVAMHVAAMKPLYLTSNDVPEDVLNAEREVYKEQSINEGKSPEIAEKMVEGRIKKYYKEVCLNDQIFIKDSSLSVRDYASKNNCTIKSMIRYEVGEGMEKRNDNFAEEVMNQVNGK